MKKKDAFKILGGTLEKFAFLEERDLDVLLPILGLTREDIKKEYIYSNKKLIK